MTSGAPVAGMEERIAAWRDRMVAWASSGIGDVDVLEEHLRGHLATLTGVGLTPDEAFLVAVQRVGSEHAGAAAVAREDQDRVWEQAIPSEEGGAAGTGALVMLGFAALAGLAVKIPFGHAVQNSSGTPYAQLVVGLLVLAAVAAGYLAWQRRPPVFAVLVGIAVVLGVFGVTQLLYPYVSPSDTQTLALLHIPIAVAVMLGAAYLGREWRTVDRWMDYTRFLGELAIYYVLIALGGGVFMGLTVGVFALIGLEPQNVVVEWILPLGVGGAVVVAAWLVESKKSVVENMAPLLSVVFTPLFTLLLLAFLGALVTSGGRLVDLDRGVLIVVNLVLAVVLGLHLFSVSARPVGAQPRWFDWLQLLLVVAAVLIDVVVLVAMAGRIGEYGASPNKVAALGENLVLAGNLIWAAWLSYGFLRGHRPFAALERWQCRYLPVVGVWAAIVVVVFPLVFGFR